MWTPRTSRSANAGQRCASAGVKSSRRRYRAIEHAGDRLRGSRPQGAQARRREIPRDPGDARRVGAVGRQVDVDDGIVEASPSRVARPDGRVVGQIDDAVVIVGKLEFGWRAEHAVGLDAPDDFLGERDFLAGDVGSDRREHAFHARSRVGGAADDLHRGAARIHHADSQPVRVRMLNRLDHPRDHEAVVFGAGVLDRLDLEADARQRIDDLGERGRRIEVVFEPGEGEFHIAVLTVRRMLGQPVAFT